MWPSSSYRLGADGPKGKEDAGALGFAGGPLPFQALA
jgi:hypothetical protein